MNTDQLQETSSLLHNVDTEFLTEVQEQLTKELDKKESQRDFRLIDELTNILYQASGAKPIETFMDQEISKILQIENQRKMKKTRTKWIYSIASVCAAAAIVLGLNTWTVYALEMNVFQTVYSVINNSIVIPLGNPESQTEPSASNDVSSEIQEKCSEYGIQTYTPHYIPDQFKLIKTDVNTSKNIDSISFKYQYKNKTLNILYTRFISSELWESTIISLPAEEPNCSEESVNGATVFVLSDDDHYSAIVKDSSQLTVLNIASWELNRTEFEKVIHSIEK